MFYRSCFLWQINDDDDDDDDDVDDDDDDDEYQSYEFSEYFGKTTYFCFRYVHRYGKLITSDFLITLP